MMQDSTITMHVICVRYHSELCRPRIITSYGYRLLELTMYIRPGATLVFGNSNEDSVAAL